MAVVNRLAVGFLLASLTLFGCGGGDQISKPPRPLKLNAVIITMEEGVNENWPVPIELVRVDDNVLVDELLNIDTNSWFGKKGSAFRVSNPTAIFSSWEIVPGTRVGPERVRARGRLAGVLFCRMKRDDPVPAIRFERDGNVIINITDEGCVLEGGTPSREPGILNPQSWKFW